MLTCPCESDLFFYILTNHGSSLKWLVRKGNERNQFLKQTTRWNCVRDYFQRLITSPRERLESQKEFGHPNTSWLKLRPLKLHWFSSLPEDKLNEKTPEQTKIETRFTTVFLHKRVSFANLLLHHLPLKNVKLLSTVMGVIVKEFQTCPHFEAYPTCPIIHHFHCQSCISSIDHQLDGIYHSAIVHFRILTNIFPNGQKERKKSKRPEKCWSSSVFENVLTVWQFIKLCEIILVMAKMKWAQNSKQYAMLITKTLDRIQR